jgi:hypothetical protein
MPTSSPSGECDEGPGEEEVGGTPAGVAEHALVTTALVAKAAEPAHADAGRRCRSAQEEVRADLAPTGTARRVRSAREEVGSVRLVPRSEQQHRAQREAAKPQGAMVEAPGLPRLCQVPEEGPGARPAGARWDHQESAPEQYLQGIGRRVAESPGQWEKRKPPQGQRDVWM